jgi:predicted permease
VTRQLLTESLVLAGLGGALGLLLASLGLKVFLALGASGIPRAGEIGLDPVVLGFSLVMTLGTGLLFGVMPAVQPVCGRLHDLLKEGGGGRGATRRSQGLRRGLVLSQIVLAAVLVTGSGLMLRTVAKLYDVDMGFTTDNILTLRVNPRSSRYDTPENVVAFHAELMDRLETLPGVVSAAAAHSIPLRGRDNNWSLILEDHPVSNVGEAPADLIQRVTPGYFETFGIDLVRGRLFNETDDAGSPPVLVVSESMARKHWPGEDPLGKRLKVFVPDWPWVEVVGVVEDVHHAGPSQEPRPRWYVPHAQAPVSAYAAPLTATIAVRTDGNPMDMLPAVRGVIAEMDPGVPNSEVRTMDQILDTDMVSQRFVMALLTVFGALVLFLAVVGVYGVASYAVSQRTREIGLRMALGAERGTVLTGVMREGLILATLGVAGGLASSILLSRVFETLVFGISPTDPLTYAGVGAVLLLAAILASLVPALRASRVSPITALRTE